MNTIKAALFGLAVGDALGVPYEFRNSNVMEGQPCVDMVGYGTHNQPPGTWSLANIPLVVFQRFLLLTVGLWCCFLQQAAAQQFHFKNYSVGDGLAQSQVFAMLEDSRGYLWMGTRGGGLSRFDGLDFVTYTVGDGLTNNFILCLFEDEAGVLWIGTDAGLCRYNGLQFETFLPEGVAAIPITAIAAGDSGQLWVGTNKGMFRFDGEKFHSYELPELKSGLISTLYRDPQQHIWYGSDDGMGKITPEGLEHFSTKDGLGDNLVRCMVEDDAGNLWIGTYGKGISIKTDSNFVSLPLGERGAEGIVLSMLKDSKGFIWAATQENGVFRWNPADSTLTNFREADGLSNNHIRTILEDSWGNLWFGSSGGGISKYAGQQFVHYDEKHGLAGRYVYSVLKDRSGRVWMGVSAKGVSIMDSTGMTYFNEDSGFLDIKVRVIYEDLDGRIWLGTEGSGIYVLDSNRVTVFNIYTGLSGNWIRDIEQDQRGHTWVATAGGGITQMVPDDSLPGIYQYIKYRESSGLSSNRINHLQVDRKGRVWFATSNDGIGYIFQDSIITTFSVEDGLPVKGVRSLIEDALGYLWIGTAGGGVAYTPLYRDSIHFQVLDHKDKLRSNNVYLLNLDKEQHLWVGSESGVDQVLLDQTRQVLEVKHYGKAEGFVGIETCQNATYRDQDGNLWFGTINGLTKYNPGTNIKNPIAPKVRITRANLFYKPLQQTKYANWVREWGNIRDGLELPYDQNHLNFEFIGINYMNPEKVRYQFWLEGFEDEWSPEGFKKDATYSNLPPGHYTFHVKASNEDGVVSDTVRVHFAVLPPFWQTWWFITACIVGGVLIIVVIFRVRLNQVRKQAASDRERLEMEKDLIQLEQKALRLQMNPHFIFNALNSIQGLIAKKDDKSARYYLAKFSKLMRLILESSRTNQIPLVDEIQMLENYLAIEKFSKGNSFDYRIVVEDDIDPDLTEIPPMMIQPFVENAIIHGVSHLEDQSGLIDVNFHMNKDYLECTIQDNGIGRVKAAALKSQVAHAHKSTALAVTQERLDIMHGSSANGHQSLEIVDLKKEDGEAGGTKVVIRMVVE